VGEGDEEVAVTDEEATPPIAEVVRRLDAWLSCHRPEYYQNLRQGLTDAQWAEFQSRLGVSLPTAFRELYQWRDGQHNDSLAFHMNQDWMCSEDIIRIKHLMDSMIGYDFEPGYWEAAWVPFLHNGGGSHLCVDVSRGGQLVEFWKADHDRPIASPSLEHWLNVFVTSLERDRWEETNIGFECVEVRS
jgi:cell wall assembly regulator SMI1